MLHDAGIQRQGTETVKDLAFSSTVSTLQGTTQFDRYFLSGAAHAGAFYLPPASEMAGRIVSVVATSVATGNVTVYPFNSSGGLAADVIYGLTGAVASFALASALAHVLLYSTGRSWIILSFDLSV